MNTATDLPRIPLSALHLSPLNARKVRPNDIDSLAASIAAHGLLQNLTVTLNDRPGEYEVVAGGRRLAAMQQLAQEGRLPEALARDGIPCLVIADNDIAHEASTAENTLREAMHPADQFDAFKRMIDAGKPIADVAAHFGVTELVVRQRLKLANVADDLVQVYREGGMDLDDLQALAVTDDHAAQRSAWFDVHDYERTAWRIRQRLTQQQVRSDRPLVRFVGLGAYEAAGGVVVRDLFSASGEAYLQDPALLDKLAADKLELQAQALRDAGWSWAEVHIGLTYQQAAEYPKLDASRAEDFLPPEKEQRLAEINARMEEIENLDTDDLDAQQEINLNDEAARLEDEREQIESETEERWPADLMQQGGALVCIDGDGAPQILLGRLKPGQKVSRSGAVTGTAKESPVAKGKTKPAKPQLAADMVNRLNAHRTAAVRAALAADSTFGPDLLLAVLLEQVVGDYNDGALKIRADNAHAIACEAPFRERFPGMPKPSTRAALDAAVKALGVPRKSAEILPWVQKLPDERFAQAQAVVAALTLGNLDDGELSRLAETMKIDMAAHWQPDAAHYLSHVNKALILAAVTEARGKDAAAKLEKLKREPLIAEAAKLLAGTGWLPKPLRGAGYKLATAAAAPAKKPARKAAPKKKPAEKAPSKPAKKGGGRG